EARMRGIETLPGRATVVKAASGGSLAHLASFCEIFHSIPKMMARVPAPILDAVTSGRSASTPAPVQTSAACSPSRMEASVHLSLSNWVFLLPNAGLDGAFGAKGCTGVATGGVGAGGGAAGG